MSLVIGLVGEIRAGKSDFVKFWQKIMEEEHPMRSMETMKFSDILFETLGAWGIEQSRVNLQKLAQAMNNEYGEGTLTRAVKARVDASSADIILIDGVRWLSDEKLIKNLNGTMLYVSADVNIRYKRALLSTEKVGENLLSFEEFQATEKAVNEIHIPVIGGRADHCIVNNWTLADFEESAEEFYHLYVGK